MNFTQENIDSIAVNISQVNLITPNVRIKILDDINLVKACSFGKVTWNLYFHDRFIMGINENQHDGSLPHLIEEAFWKHYTNLYFDSIKSKIWLLALNGKPIELPEYQMTGKREFMEIGDGKIKQLLVRYKDEPVLVINHVVSPDHVVTEVMPELLRFIKREALKGNIDIPLFDK